MNTVIILSIVAILLFIQWYKANNTPIVGSSKQRWRHRSAANWKHQVAFFFLISPFVILISQFN